MRPPRCAGGVRPVLLLAVSLLVGAPVSGAAGQQAPQALLAGALAAERIFIHDQNHLGPLDQVLAAVRGVMAEDDPLRAALLERLSHPRPDRFFSETGAPAEGASEGSGPDIRSVVLAFGPLAVQVEFVLTAPPAFPGSAFVIAFRLPAPDPDIPMGRWVAPEDAAIIARFHGVASWTLRAALGDGEERSIPGTVEADGVTVRIGLPIATIAGLGLARPGIQMAFRAVGPPPRAVVDRAPERGGLQIGLPGRMNGDAVAVIEQVDFDGDGRGDLFYYDADNNGRIDAAGRDRNGDGRIEFLAAEGPGRFLDREGRPAEFPRVDRLRVGRRQAYRLSNGQATYMTVIEDLNGDGDVADAEEFRGFYISPP
ncbi:MAG TPA: hypothetical protein VGR25_00310 [bacterium]|nr:hypothetical protein [bacterium]